MVLETEDKARKKALREDRMSIDSWGLDSFEESLGHSITIRISSSPST